MAMSSPTWCPRMCSDSALVSEKKGNKVKRSGAVLFVIAALALPASVSASPTAHVSCSSHYTSATIGGSHKCLHAGEYCARRYERQYERYSYECSTSYSPPRLRRR
jgi:hypothetical protein